MRNKLILFLMLALFGSTSFLRADEVQIGSGDATNSYLPSYSFYNYSLTQQIYTAEEIGVGAGTISSIAFYNGGTEKTRQYDVYFVNTTKAAFDGTTDWITVTEADKVFTGTVTLVAGDWTTLTLTAPFAYDGTNLAVIVDDNTGSWSSGMACRVFDATSQAIRVYSDPTNYDPTNPGTYTGTILDVKNQIVLNITPSSGPTPPTPPAPTGEFTLTPLDWALGERPINGWMEPFTARIYNGGYPTEVEGSMSNTTGVNPFFLSQEINQMLETGDAIDFEVLINNEVADGDYTEEFTLFYADSERSIITVPVTASLYTAGVADIIETKRTIPLSYTNGISTFTHTPVNLHANYLLQGMTEMKKDAVYVLNLSTDSKLSVTAGDGIIAIYKTRPNFHPTAATEPLAIVNNGQMTDQILIAGKYFLIVASDNITTVEGTVEQLPEPTALTLLAPADGATGLAGDIALTWEGGDNATSYRVLFGTSPTNLPVAMDWTPVDDNYGTFDVSDYVSPNTQYFWQIEAKNSAGTVTSPRWGFTTALIAPYDVTATEEEIFTDESTVIKWKLAGTSGFSGSITVADGTTTNSYLPVYGLWCDYYTRGEMIYPAEMLEEMVGGDITSLEFYLSTPASAAWAPDVFQVYFQEVDATTLSTYYTAANAQICYTGYLDGTAATMNITLDEPYHYNGGNLLLGIQETINGNYKSASFYGIEATGTSASGYDSSALANVTFNQRNFLPKVTFHCGDERNINLAKSDRTFQGFNLYDGDTKVNTELITERQYLLSNLTYNLTPGHDIAVTAVYSEGESEKSAPVYVHVSGYGTLTGTVTELISSNPVAGANVKFFGSDEFGNDVNYEAVTNNSGVYTMTVKAGTYNRAIVTYQGMEAASMTDNLTVAFDGTTTKDFVMHEVYNPIYKVYAQELEPSTAKVTWSLFDFVNPTPGGNTPGGGSGSGSSFTEGFEGGMPAGWNVIDANNDGWTWCMTSAIPSTWTYYASMTLDWYRSGSNAICSGSYINGVGALSPDEYLVTPQVTLANGSTFSFWAAATDAGYPADHFGVFVSNNGTSDWTMVNEWTLTAKSNGVAGGQESRDGNGAKLGTWYQYTVDLSAHAGDKYIAIRHFNCNDQYIMCVDDIELTSGSKGTRAVQDYALFRKAILKENGLVPADSVCLGVIPAPDTLYADFEWNNMEPGLYQYGVSALYPSHTFTRGNRDEVIIGEGTTTNAYVPTYNLYNYSCTNQIYTAEEIGGAGTINSIAFMPATVNTPSRTLKIYMVNTDKTSFSGGNDWVPVTDADLVFDGTVNWIANQWSTIALDTPFLFDGTNLCVVVNDLTGSWTSSNQYYVFNATAQAIRIYQDSAPYNPSAPGTGTVINVKNQIKLDIDFGAGTSNDNPITDITWSNILPKNMTTSVAVSALVPVGTAEGAEVRFHNTFEEVNDIVAVLDSTGMVEWPEFRKGNYELTVDLEGYTCAYANTPIGIWDETNIEVIFEEVFKPVDGIAVSQTGFARWDDILPHERVAERYVVTLDGSLYTETTDNYLQFENLEEGPHTAGVAVIYSTGISTYKYANFNYVECVPYTFDTLYATNEEMEVTLHWANGTTPPTPPTPPTPGNTFDFDDGTMMGWTSLDANNDGYGWVAGNAVGGVYLVAGASLEGSGHNSSAGLVCSGSYSNYTGAAITPDNYLVSPAKGQYSSISFWACGQDASYVAEHFGVAVSTTNNTSGSAFTTVQEWTMTAKGEGAMSIGRDGQPRVQGNWHEYTVDLSAYAGQEIWVAIRHFNCTDMFILDVDDISLGTSAKALEDGTIGNAGLGYGTINNSLTDDGNWYYYDNGINDDAIGLTAGGSFYWGIMFPAGTYEGNSLTKVSYFDYSAHTGTVIIYQGGTSAPGTQLYSQAYSVSGTQQYVDIEMAEPVELDETQNLWVVMHNNNGQYVAAIDAGPGVNYGSCLSMDGSTWYTMVNQAAASLDGNWNLRAYIEAGGSAPTGASVVVPNKFNIFVDGELVGVAAANATDFTWTCPDYAEHLYEVVWIDSNYNFSCPASIVYQIMPTNVGESSVINAIYPNPTSGDLYVKANDMVRISVVNMLGQVVYDMAVEGNETVINMGRFEAGLYMVNVVTKNGSSVERVVVK